MPYQVELKSVAEGVTRNPTNKELVRRTIGVFSNVKLEGFRGKRVQEAIARFHNLLIELSNADGATIPQIVSQMEKEKGNLPEGRADIADEKSSETSHNGWITIKVKSRDGKSGFIRTGHS